MLYLDETTKTIVFKAVSACCAVLDELAPNQYDKGPINSNLAYKLEKVIEDHIKNGP